jgi:hypothetical protein
VQDLRAFVRPQAFPKRRNPPIKLGPLDELPQRAAGDVDNGLCRHGTIAALRKFKNAIPHQSKPTRYISKIRRAFALRMASRAAGANVPVCTKAPVMSNIWCGQSTVEQHLLRADHAFAKARTTRRR